MVFEDWVDRFAFWNGFHPDLQTLLIYGVGIAVYTALVFAFYQNISQRDPLHGKLRKSWWGRVVHAGETILTFPILSFGYFAVLSLALFVLAKPERETADILLLSMACVMGVRFTAHLAERMSNDLAKLLPLSLLAVVVVDPGYLTIVGVFDRLAQGGALIPVLLQYFVLFIVVEAGLRGVRGLAPTILKFTGRLGHKHGLSKRAMLRDVAHEHDGGSLFHRHSHQHDHAPRDRSQDFITLDESVGGRPGARQGLGPAVSHRANQHHGPTMGGSLHRPSPKGGPNARA